MALVRSPSRDAGALVRNIAVLRCANPECLFLEFPGCGVCVYAIIIAIATTLEVVV